MGNRHIVIIGGGAAGIFAAIRCKEMAPLMQVTVLERSRHLLSKVRISGGGRCNVTHACFDPLLLSESYPRGGRALRGPFTQFQPKDMIAWLEAHGVEVKAEPDGRMFPKTDSSDTIVRCFLGEAKKLGVAIRTQTGVLGIQKPNSDEEPFKLLLAGDEILSCQRLLIATGSNPQMYPLIEGLGHTIVNPVPSLFTLNIKDERLEGLAGVSVQDAEISIEGSKYRQRGPVLVTHWGLSGPATIKLSAWGARIFNENDYHVGVRVNWLPDLKREQAVEQLQKLKKEFPKRSIGNENLFTLPKRLWRKLIIAAGIDEKLPMAQMSNAHMRKLEEQLLSASFKVEGKSTYKEEFVTAGGVELKEINFKRMESKVCPRLHFAGEVLDVDGITGGFNFQNAWTGATLAAAAMTER